MGFAEPSRSPDPLVSSYLTVSPLPAGDCEQPPAGGLLSVALSRTLRPVDVIHHGILRSPDFPPAAAACTLGEQEAARPTIAQFARNVSVYRRQRAVGRRKFAAAQAIAAAARIGPIRHDSRVGCWRRRAIAVLEK